MGTEQRIREYRRRYRSVKLIDLARVFRMPVREIREILGLEPKPPWPMHGPCLEESLGGCRGEIRHHWNEEDWTWEQHCTTHYPDWCLLAEEYGDVYTRMVEEDLSRHNARTLEEIVG